MKKFQKIKMQITLKIAVILSLLAIACSETQLPQKLISAEQNLLVPDVIKKSKNDKREYKIIHLANELELMLVSDNSLERSAVALAVKAGSYNESNGFWGQAHFLEHMLFLGTKKYPEEGSFNAFISSNGGVNNAYTDMDHTNYMASVKNNAYEELLDRFSDYFKSPLLSPKYIDKERNAVHSEWSMKGVYDGVILGHLNRLTLNPEHPVAHFTWGNLSSLNDQNGQTLQQATEDFFNKFYQANRMKVTLVSNRSISELEKMAKLHFGTVTNNKTQASSITTPAITNMQLKKLIRYTPKKELKKIQLKFVIADNSSQYKSKPNYYVSYLLNSEMPDTLKGALKTKGLIEGLSAWADPNVFGNSGEFVIDIDLTEQGLLQRDSIISTVFNYLSLIESKGISTQYYLEIKQSLTNSFDHQSKYSEYNYAANLAAKMHEIPNNDLLSSDYEFSTFNKENIQQLLAQLTINNVRVFYIDKGQKTNKSMRYFDATYAIDDITPEQLQLWQSPTNNIELALPKLNTLLPSDFYIVDNQKSEKPKAIATKLGSVLHIKHSDQFSIPKGSISVNLNTAVGSKNAKEQALLLVLNKAFSEELSEISSQAYGAGMSLVLNNNQGLTMVTTGFSDKQFTLQLEAFSALTKLKLSKAKFEQFIKAIKITLGNKKNNALYNQAFDHYRTFLINGNYSSEDLMRELNNFTLNDLTIFSAQFFNSVKLNTFIFGNFEQSQSVNFVETLETLLKINIKNKASPIYRKQYYQFEADERVNIKINVEQNDVALIDAKWQKRTLEREATGILLAKIVSPALFKQIRTEEQLGYSVGFYSTVRNDQVTYAWYVQTPVKSPQDMLARFDAFKSMFGSEILKIDETALDKYRQAVLVTLAQQAKNIYEEQNDYLSDWQVGNLSFNSKPKLIQAIKTVTSDDIKKLYQQLVDPDKMARVIIQIKGKNFADSNFIELNNAKSK